MVPNMARIAAPLYEAAKAKTKKTFVWTPECEKSFQKAKTALADATMLVHPKPGAAFKNHH